MGLLESVIRGLTWFFCGPRAQSQQYPEEEVYVPPSAPHKPHVPGQQPSYAHPHPQQEHYQPQPIPQPRPQEPQVQRPHVNKCEDNRQNPVYIALRKRADEVAADMHRFSRESQEAWQRDEKALAKELSNKSKEKRAELERLNQENAEWLFRENNKDRPENEIDLHGMTVDQAIQFSERAIQSARQRGDSQIRLITGKGLHSTDGIPKIKPAIEALMVKYELVAELDPNNSGVLIVSLDGHDRGTGSVVHSDEIARRINDEHDDRCIVM